MDRNRGKIGICIGCNTPKKLWNNITLADGSIVKACEPCRMNQRVPRGSCAICTRTKRLPYLSKDQKRICVTCRNHERAIKQNCYVCTAYKVMIGYFEYGGTMYQICGACSQLDKSPIDVCSNCNKRKRLRKKCPNSEGRLCATCDRLLRTKEQSCFNCNTTGEALPYLINRDPTKRLCRKCHRRSKNVLTTT